MLGQLHKALVGRRLNPQKPQSPPYFEGWYTRVISPTHSFGIITGYYPDQTPKHSAAYTAILVNHDQHSSALQTFEAYLPPGSAPVGLTVERGDTQGEQQTDFLFKHGGEGEDITIQGQGADLLYEAHVGGASASFRSLSGSTPWSDGGGGSPQGLLHLLPGLGLHWYVHSTLTRVAYDVKLPDGQGHLTGEGWAHVEKNWGGSFPRSFIWSQGFASLPPSTQAGPTAAADGSDRQQGHVNSNNGRTSGMPNASVSGNGDGNGDGNGSDNSNGNGSSSSSQSKGKDAPYGTHGQPQASFCLAGGVLPTLNMDKLPVALPDVVLLGYVGATLQFIPEFTL